MYFIILLIVIIVIAIIIAQSGYLPQIANLFSGAAKTDGEKIGGGKPHLVIHISGPSGSGKTTLGNKLKESFGDKIIVKDIDDLRDDFVVKFYGSRENFQKNKPEWNSVEYQKYIDEYVESQKKPLIFVGLNHMPWWNETLYYDMHADHKFYIDIDSGVVFRQKCGRFIDDFFVKNRDKMLSRLEKDNIGALKIITSTIESECNYAEVIEHNNMWNRDYKLQGYTCLPRDDIFAEVSKIIVSDGLKQTLH